MSSKQLTPNSVETLQTKIRFKSQSYQVLIVPSQKLAHPNHSIQPTGRISFSNLPPPSKTKTKNSVQVSAKQNISSAAQIFLFQINNQQKLQKHIHPPNYLTTVLELATKTYIRLNHKKLLSFYFICRSSGLVEINLHIECKLQKYRKAEYT